MKVLKKNELLDIILDFRARDSYRKIVINELF